MEINDNLVKSNDNDDDAFHLSANNNNNNHRGAVLVKSSLHSTVDRPLPIDSSRSRFRSRHRRLRKKMHLNKLKNSSNHFQSIGTYSNNHRASKPIDTILDGRLKRFRMLDPDEFQEMLNSWSYNTASEPIKGFNNMDTIGGMQLESKFA